MTTLNIEDLKQVIDLLQLGWKAGETSVSRLRREEKEGRLGALLTPEQFASFKARIQEIARVRGPAPTYPPTHDWRAERGADWTTPIKDQGACGACVAFATVGAIESVHKISKNQPGIQIDLSEAFLFFCGGGNCETGWYIPPALDFAKDPGIADEDCFPYPDPAHQEPCERRCDDWLNRLQQIVGWSDVFQTDEMKAWISSKGPLVTQMEIYEDFFHYTSRVYEHVMGDFLGYHAVTVVGYNDPERYWICKNSWGPGWGEGGWFRIRYTECGIATKFPMYTAEV